MIKLIGFDLDDTLWEVAPVIHRAERMLTDWLRLEAPDLDYTVESMRDLRQELLAEDRELARQITEFRRRLIELALFRSNIAQATEISHAAIEVFLKARNEIEFFEGTEAVLNELSKHFVLGALSNGNADIHRLGLGDLFSFAYSAEQVGAPKPSPALFNAALDHANIKPEQMIYVGDDPELDIDAPHALGIRTIWINHGIKPLSRTIPDETIKDIRDLPDAVAKLNND